MLLGCVVGGSGCGVWPAMKPSRSYRGARLPATLYTGVSLIRDAWVRD